MKKLLKRELVILVGAPATWVVLALCALLIGHGFVLALDLFAAASRSALGQQLMRRELDPLLGVVRPTLGGLQLAVALLLPILAARPLAVEKERKSYAALALRVGSAERVIVAKLLAAWTGCALLLAIPLILLCGFALAGGHLWPSEIGVALTGYALFALLISSVSVAAAAATSSFAQAAALGMLLSLGSWAIDASEGFSALAWLSDWRALSVGAQLLDLERGVLAWGAVSWLVTTTCVAVVVAMVAGRIDRSWQARLLLGLSLLVLPIAGRLSMWQRAVDCTEQQRMSLPPAVATALSAHHEPLRITVWLERDDARRTQLERDVLAKIVLARPDVEIRTPFDGAASAAGAQHGAAYGWLEIRSGTRSRRTRSTSRKEVTTLIFETLGEALPDWSQSAYPGFPWVPSASVRRALVVLAYGILPLACIALGIVFAHRRRSL
jgi:hypothetical protein